MKNTVLVAILACALGLPAGAGQSSPAPPVPEVLKAYDLDFNWGPGGPNGFARPGLWADADPARHVAWYKTMGANVIQTFCVSCNGYAWYKHGVVPEQPGLKHDFLPEVVRLGHQEGLLVLGYFCMGANTKWGQEHPQLSYGFPDNPHIPFTDEYLAYLDSAIRDAVGKTGIDGFMVDWLRLPTSRASNGGHWLECEKKLYTQLMGGPFPGEQQLSPAKMTEYGRRALERCWTTLRRAAKETNPKCLVWLSSHDINDPDIANSRALRETDWFINEAGDLKRTAAAKKMISPQARLITCLANWNRQDPMEIIPAALKEGIGLYGFTKPGADSLLPLEALLSRPLGELKGDEKNIAALARAFHGASAAATWGPDGRFVEPQTGPAATRSIPLLTEQGPDGEFPGWKSFHERPGTRTADVWQLQPDSVLICKGSPRGYLYTERNYQDFTLQFEWRYPPGATNSNGGALVRMTGEHGIWPRCLEFQLNQNQAGDFWAIRGFEFTGPAEQLQVMTNASFGVLRHLKRQADREKPVGEWNQFEGIVDGGTVIQKVNGAVVNQATGCDVVAGKILITSEGQEIQFRNLRLVPRR